MLLFVPNLFVAASSTAFATDVYPPLPFASDYGGKFKLTSHEGKLVTQKYFYGRHLILYFGFTDCPDTCPTALLTIGNTLEQLGPLGEGIIPLFINLDPERTSLENMKKYVGYFHPRFLGLTGTAAQIKTAATGYQVRYRAFIQKNGTQSIVHSGKIFFVGPDGKVIAYYPHEAPSRWLVKSILDHM